MPNPVPPFALHYTDDQVAAIAAKLQRGRAPWRPEEPGDIVDLLAAAHQAGIAWACAVLVWIVDEEEGHVLLTFDVHRLGELRLAGRSTALRTLWTAPGDTKSAVRHLLDQVRGQVTAMFQALAEYTALDIAALIATRDESS